VVNIIQVIIIHDNITLVQQVVLNKVSFPFLLVFIHIFIHIPVKRYLLVELEDIIHLLPNVTPLVFEVTQFAFGFFFHQEHLTVC